MTDEANHPLSESGQEATSSGSDSPPSEAPPSWFADYAAKMDGRLSSLGRDLGRLRERIPKKSTGAPMEGAKPANGDPTSTQPTPSASPDLGPEWQKQFRAQTRREASLSSEALEWLDEATEGMDLSARGKVLDAYLAGASAKPAKAPPIPTITGGRAATAAPRQSAAHPSTKSEYMAMSRRAQAGGVNSEAKKQWDRLHEDPTFSPVFDR